MRMSEMEFSEKMAELPEPPVGAKPPFWEAWRHELWWLAQNRDPTRFFSWPPVYHTMLVNHWVGPVWHEYAALPPSWHEYAEAPDWVGPIDYHGETKLSRNLIHQLYHLYQFEQATGRSVKDMGRIDEFGGGYGAMAHVIHRMGFRGDYRIYDLPEFALLQQYYLSQFGIQVTHCDKMEGKTDLLIACYSLSETPLQLRDRFLDDTDAGSYLLLYSNRFVDYDNEKYFGNMGIRKPECLWRHQKVEHLPPSSIYSFGWTA